MEKYLIGWALSDCSRLTEYRYSPPRGLATTAARVKGPPDEVRSRALSKAERFRSRGRIRPRTKGSFRFPSRVLIRILIQRVNGLPGAGGVKYRSSRRDSFSLVVWGLGERETCHTVARQRFCFIQILTADLEIQ